MNKKTKVRLMFVNGLKQSPIDLDFHITPSLTFSRTDKNEFKDLGSAWGICIEWGYWAVGIGVYTVVIK